MTERTRQKAERVHPARACVCIASCVVYIRSMSENRKANVEGATYFVTFTLHGWVDVFTRKELADERWNGGKPAVLLSAVGSLLSHDQ